MLIDFISPQNLPNWVVWVDWQFYAHKDTLFLLIAIAVGLWMLWCLKEYGVAVG